MARVQLVSQQVSSQLEFNWNGVKLIRGVRAERVKNKYQLKPYSPICILFYLRSYSSYSFIVKAILRWFAQKAQSRFERARSQIWTVEIYMWRIALCTLVYVQGGKQQTLLRSNSRRAQNQTTTPTNQSLKLIELILLKYIKISFKPILLYLFNSFLRKKIEWPVRWSKFSVKLLFRFFFWF